MPKILKVIDKSDNHIIDNGILPDVRFFGLLCGKTGASKTTLMVNMICSKEFPYDAIFKGSDIRVFSSSLSSDEKIKKMIEYKQIPEENLYDKYDNQILHDLYDEIEENYNEKIENGEPPDYPLIIIDDLSFNLGRGKDFNALIRFAQNSRKLSCSVLITTQHYAQIPLSVRNNISFAVLYNTSSKNLAIIEEEHNYLENKKAFFSMWRTNVLSKRDYIVVNYDNDNLEIYLDKEWKPIFK